MTLGGLSFAAFFIATVVIFGLTNLIGNWFDVAMLGLRHVTPGEFEALRNYFRPDLPIYERYFAWMGQLLSGNFGPSLISAGPLQIPLWTMYSVVLFLPALMVGGGIGGLLGAHSSAGGKGFRYRLLSDITTFIASLPNFWIGLLSLLVIALWLNLLPAAGVSHIPGTSYWWGGTELDFFAHWILPFAVLAATYFAIFFQVTSAKASTKPAETTVKGKLVAVAGMVGPVFALTLPLTLSLEVVFAWPGLGLFLYESVNRLDVVVVANVSLILAAIIILITFVGKAISALGEPVPADESVTTFVSPKKAFATLKGRFALGLGVILLVLVLWGALFAPYPPRDFTCLFNGCTNLPPFTSAAHPFGSEVSGIDVFSDTLHGLANDVGLALGTALVGFVAGSLIATLSQTSKPLRSLFEGLFYIAIITPIPFSLLWLGRTSPFFIFPTNLVVLPATATCLLGSLTVGYLARGPLKEGAGGIRSTANRALVPSLVVAAAAIAIEGLVAFLGSSETVVSLGTLISEGYVYIRTEWWTVFFPGVFMSFAILTFLLLADVFREIERPDLPFKD